MATGKGNMTPGEVNSTLKSVECSISERGGGTKHSTGGFHGNAKGGTPHANVETMSKKKK